MKKTKRKVIAQETLKAIEQGFYTNSNDEKIWIKEPQETALRNTHLYTPEELDQLITTVEVEKNLFETSFETWNETTLNAVRQLVRAGEENVLCLNFASARNPGGGFLGGAQAQEESIARASGLYPTLLKCEKYYTTNRAFSSCLYTDHMIYTPKVPVFRLENGDWMDKLVTVSVITAPAVNAGVVRRNANEKRNIPKIEPTMERRIDMVLAIAKVHEYETLVLGAWGCGVFQNDPEMVARLFDEALNGKYKGQFKKVIFAVYTKINKIYQPFANRF